MACGEHSAENPENAEDFKPTDARAEHDDDLAPIHEAFYRVALNRIAAEPRGML